jgi:hypothetical protein
VGPVYVLHLRKLKAANGYEFISGEVEWIEAAINAMLALRFVLE